MGGPLSPYGGGAQLARRPASQLACRPARRASLAVARGLGASLAWLGWLLGCFWLDSGWILFDFGWIWLGLDLIWLGFCICL